MGRSDDVFSSRRDWQPHGDGARVNAVVKYALAVVSSKYREEYVVAKSRPGIGRRRLCTSTAAARNALAGRPLPTARGRLRPRRRCWTGPARFCPNSRMRNYAPRFRRRSWCGRRRFGASAPGSRCWGERGEEDSLGHRAGERRGDVWPEPDIFDANGGAAERDDPAATAVLAGLSIRAGTVERGGSVTWCFRRGRFGCGCGTRC